MFQMDTLDNNTFFKYMYDTVYPDCSKTNAEHDFKKYMKDIKLERKTCTPNYENNSKGILKGHVTY